MRRFSSLVPLPTTPLVVVHPLIKMPSATARKRSTSRKRYYSGLAFGTLVVQVAGSRGASIPRSRELIPRKDKPGGNTSDTTDSDDTDTDTDDDDPPPTHSRSSTGVSKTSSQTATSINSSTTSTPSSSVGSNGSSSSSHTSQTPLPSQDAIITSELRKPISTGGVVGAVLGSLIITGLILMLLARCINRARKAKKRPQGFVPSAFFNSSPHQEEQPLHPTEMSQTQSSPLIVPAVAARATSSGSPYSHYSSSWSSNPANTITSTSPSLSPQILATSLNHPRSVGYNSEQTGSRSSETASSIHEPLHSPYESPPYSLAASSSTRLSALPILAAPGAAVLGAATVVAHDHSGLHRSMVAHQKSLEAEDKSQEGRMQVLKSTEDPQTNDPPPRYDA